MEKFINLLLFMAWGRDEFSDRHAEAAPTPGIKAMATNTARKGAKPLSAGLAQWIEIQKPRPQRQVEASARSVASSS